MIKEQREQNQMSVEETVRTVITLQNARECLESPYLRKEQEQELRPLTIALASELIFFGNDEAFKEDLNNSPI